ncbi:NAD(P)/FAD-dependent oxidoreductase [Brevundimonas sp.]|jgi:L-2-hydroxyglutarate oxidase LhgO|uniref:NAD(P)/FAD-dependent oxidoreductase n=1 Tax=Brevundimonas sp. TaxID=1871086 RepID=UPI00378361A6
MDTIECVVIGAGVVGLAAARALAMAGREVIILERETHIGSGVSSRNSEVIHAGIYYPQGSLKARLCVEGRQALYDYCASRHIPHRRCGKLIVATHADQIPELHRIAAAAAANGVDDLTWLTAEQARAMEPALACVAALLSPSTGIIDSHAYMLSLLGEAEAGGAMIAYGTPVTRLRLDADGVALTTGEDDEPRLKARLVVNSTGLDAPDLADRVEGLTPDHQATAHYAKGSYFTLSGRSPFSRLIYPTPEPGGLGVHLTLDMGGQAKFGPDVEWVAAPDYDVDPARADKFYGAVRRYWPALADDALTPGYAGVRPKISGPGEPAADFRIDVAPGDQRTGLINLFGIESPGLTSSLAIADVVAAHAAEILDV